MSYNAEKVGQIPLAPIRRVLQEWMEQQDYDRHLESYRASKGYVFEITPLERLSFATGIERDVLDSYHGRKGKQYIEFDNADLIITYINPFLWRSDPELREIYESFDLTGIDHLKPTVRKTELEELLDAGMTQRAAAAVLGMQQGRISEHLKRLRPKVAA